MVVFLMGDNAAKTFRIAVPGRLRRIYGGADFSGLYGPSGRIAKMKMSAAKRTKEDNSFGKPLGKKSGKATIWEWLW